MILLAYINSQGWKFFQTDLPIQVADEETMARAIFR